MSVLQRKELEDSPLADLHAIASELGLEGFRTLRRERLIDSILKAQGGEGADDDEADTEGKSPEELQPGIAVQLIPGAVERADGLFRTARAPWCPEVF